MWSLGALVRREDRRVLTYEGIEGSGMYNNACWPDVHDLRAHLELAVQSRYLSVLQKKRAPSIQKGWAFISVGEDADIDEEVIRRFKRLLSEVERDILRYSIPRGTPACLYSTPVVRAHEEMHALFQSLYPKPSPNSPTFQKEMQNREGIIWVVSFDFLESVGPANADLVNALQGRIPSRNTEEVLAGIYGMVALWGRMGAYSGSRMNEEGLKLTHAFASYMVRGGPPPNYEQMVFAATSEWYNKFGTGLSRVRRELAAIFKEAR